jgi:hypothetical protein
MFNDRRSGTSDGCLLKDFGGEVKKKKNTISAIFFIFFRGIPVIGLMTAIHLVLHGPYGLSFYTHCGLRHSATTLAVDD